MLAEIADTSIRRVRIVDDEQSVRDAYEYLVEELELEPIAVEGPLPALDDFIDETIHGADAAICDYKLRIRQYATFDGAETVARLYGKKFPAILCTRWELASLDEIRPYRRFIPVMLRPDELDPASLVQGFQRCIDEFKGTFQSNRRPWRTLVRIEEIDMDRQCLYLVVPGWNRNEVIRLRTSDLPKEIFERIGDQKRFHAQINIGAEGSEELYFERWEAS